MKHQHDIFCRAFVGAAKFNATQAYLVAYPDVTEPTARVNGCRLLTNANIQDRIHDLLKATTDRLDIKADDVLRLIWLTATADPNELVEVQHVCCRHCYGIDHRYQYTRGEWERITLEHQHACNDAINNDKREPREPDPAGGTGYDARMPPYPECPECNGLGEERVRVKDTRSLSPAARQLYAGAKQTRNGIEIQTRSQEKAIEMLGRYFSMFTDKFAHTSPDGSMSPVPAIDASKLSTTALKELMAARGIDVNEQ